ncbi:unnamed protein product, partial [Mesorhabditis belari]|uniref:Uncharacterized protein n=1 Tax=Mesorhabditis belari TaxID=2138241 RepID=A0AAF3FE99_9BILA
MLPKKNEPKSSNKREDEEEKEKNSSREPSTSTADQVCSIDDATTIFERLHITQGIPQKDVKKPLEKRDNMKKTQGAADVDTRPFAYQLRVRWRWRPYCLPKRFKASRNDMDVIKTLERIKWREEVDVDELRNKLLVPIPCSVEASRIASVVQQDHEVDELAEYFGCFVCVESKMSALAESMYC